MSELNATTWWPIITSGRGRKMDAEECVRLVLKSGHSDNQLDFKFNFYLFIREDALPDQSLKGLTAPIDAARRCRTNSMLKCTEPTELIAILGNESEFTTLGSALSAHMRKMKPISWIRRAQLFFGIQKCPEASIILKEELKEIPQDALKDDAYRKKCICALLKAFWIFTHFDNMKEDSSDSDTLSPRNILEHEKRKKKKKKVTSRRGRS